MGLPMRTATCPCASSAKHPRRESRIISANHDITQNRVMGAKPPPKTNAMRLLDSLDIAYETRAYEVDPNDLAAETVAAKIGLPPEQVFKTLAARGDRNGVCLAVIPGNALLNLKALAHASGDRKIDTVPLAELQALTGYIRGAVTALGCKKDYPVYVDETAQLFDVISISAGQRGIQILVSPTDYCRAVRAAWASIAKDK